jgi:hypothetical protein
VVSVLLSRGANVMLKDNSGKGALQHSSYKTTPLIERIFEKSKRFCLVRLFRLLVRVFFAFWFLFFLMLKHF